MNKYSRQQVENVLVILFLWTVVAAIVACVMAIAYLLLADPSYYVEVKRYYSPQ